jgi:hypothetical protein
VKESESDRATQRERDDRYSIVTKTTIRSYLRSSKLSEIRERYRARSLACLLASALYLTDKSIAATSLQRSLFSRERVYSLSATVELQAASARIAKGN